MGPVQQISPPGETRRGRWKAYALLASFTQRVCADSRSVPDRPARPGTQQVVISGSLVFLPDRYSYKWRGPLADDELVDLVLSHGGRPEPGWWDRIRPYSLGWVTARAKDGSLVGFVNVAWDGGDHAFLLDTKTRGTYQRGGIATRLVGVAVRQATAAGCEWIHVDFEEELAAFYFDACGFRPTTAGLIHLRESDV
jgi:GNAT superfamily N-acetyltransferase